MTDNYKNYNFLTNKLIPVDELVQKVLYEPNIGYYSKKIPFGRQGDFVTQGLLVGFKRALLH